MWGLCAILCNLQHSSSGLWKVSVECIQDEKGEAAAESTEEGLQRVARQGAKRARCN